MSLRTILISSKLWARTRRARKLYKKALLALRLKEIEAEEMKASFSLREEALIRRYEIALDKERQYLRSFQREMIDRFLQLQRLNPTLIVESKGNPPRIAGEAENRGEIELPKAVQDQVEETRLMFYQDGLDLGKDKSEIYSKWNEIQPKVIEDAMAIVDSGSLYERN